MLFAIVAPIAAARELPLARGNKRRHEGKLISATNPAASSALYVYK